MSKKTQKIYTAQNVYTDRAKIERDKLPELNVKICTLETSFLLIDSLEDDVLITVFKHIMDFVRKQDENVELVKEKGLLEKLITKDFFITNEDPIIRRLALYLGTTMVETINTLKDFDQEKTETVMDICLRYYDVETDDFCIEYLSVIMNKCLDDPQVAQDMTDKESYLHKMFQLIANTPNPDTLLHSMEGLGKILQLLDPGQLHDMTLDPLFPIDRFICDLTNDFKQIRSAALKVIKTLIVDTGDDSVFAINNRRITVLQQLTKMFCDNAMADNAYEVVEVLATAMRTEKMTQIFFEYNLFDKIMHNLEVNSQEYSPSTKCKIIAIFAETAKYMQFLLRLHLANVTQLFLDCLLYEDPPATHVLFGLNRIMKLTEAAKIITEAYEQGVIVKLLALIQNIEVNIKTREQSAELINNLLCFLYHDTAGELVKNKLNDVLGFIFEQEWADISIDFILTLLAIIENLAQNSDYRLFLTDSDTMTKNLALLLKRAFSASIVVNNIFRCLCTLVDEEKARTALLENYISPSIKRGLKSLANLVKTSVTNFIMQTTRFQEFLLEYIDEGVLEVLIMHQKHAFCVSTWNPAIESILSKTPTLKFCIRNHLSFTDITAGSDFLVSKAKFDDFRIFQNILKQEVSALDPIVVMNFDRPENPPELVVHVPIECFGTGEKKDGCPWQYCRKPGDPDLPKYLDELNEMLASYGLVENPSTLRRCVDFENVAKRAKLIAMIVSKHLSEGIKPLDINAMEECSFHMVKCHLRELGTMAHCNFIPLGKVRSGCQFERAILFKGLADQIGMPSTLQRSVDGRILFNEVPLPVENEYDIHCDKKTMKFMPWRMLRPTHIVDLLFNVGDLYALQSRQALQYLRLF